jgi:hypothetical protein
MADKSIKVNDSIIVEIIDDNKPIKITGHSVIIRLSNGTPVAIVHKLGQENTYLISRVDDYDFNNIIKDLGLDITEVHVEEFSPFQRRIF